MAKEIKMIAVTFNFIVGNGWNIVSHEIVAHDPAAAAGSIDKIGANMPFENFPATPGSMTLAEFKTALMDAAETQHDIV